MKEDQYGDGPVEAVMLPEAGARLHRLRAFGHDLLRTPSDPRRHLREPYDWGAYVMAPWCNRTPAEPIAVAGQTVSLASNWPDGTAIHGQVADARWEATSGEGEYLVRGGGDGWPWDYEVKTTIAVTGATVSLTSTLTNRSALPMPGGLGVHPWWRRPLRVAVDAAIVYPSNLEPAGIPAPVAGALDLRRLGAPADGLDGTWTAIGDRAVDLDWPDLGIRATLRLSATADHVAVATPQSLDAAAVEWQTHAPGGLARIVRGDRGAMKLLEPGEAMRIDAELVFRQAETVRNAPERT